MLPASLQPELSSGLVWLLLETRSSNHGNLGWVEGSVRENRDWGLAPGLLDSGALLGPWKVGLLKFEPDLN